MTPVSAVLITLNEEKIIEKTLKALDWCDEIVVVDSGSTDSTLEICRRYRCKVFHRDFDGYGPQKRFAIAQASNEWIFALDADEVLSAELRQELIDLFSGATPTVQGFYIPRSLIFLGRLMRFGGEYKKPILRLFSRKAGNYNDKILHEGIELTGQTQHLKHQLLHYSYASLSQYLQKFDRYSSAGAMEAFTKNKRYSKAYIMLRFPLEFFKLYILKLFILDGYQGFLWALMSSIYPVIKYAKLRELQNLD